MRNRFMRRAVVCILALAMMLSFDGVSTIASAAKAKAKAPKISSKSIVVKVGSVSYTHLTLPTTSRV